MRRRASILGAVCALGAVACPGTESIDRIPDDVAFVALLAVEDDRIVDASTIRPADEAITFFAPDDRDLMLVGYAESPLSAWIEQYIGTTDLPADRLRPADDCGPALPAPVWLARSTDGAPFTDGSADDAPRLTADWLTDRCPELDADDVSVNIGCTTSHCLDDRVKTGPCRFELDLSRCSQPTLEVLALPDGSACVTPTPRRTCSAGAPVLDPAASLSCSVQTDLGREINACVTEVYFTPQPFLQVVVDRRVVTSSATNVPGWAIARQSPIFDSDDLRRGPLLDIVAGTDRIAVLGLPPDTVDGDARCGSGPRPRHLYVLDPATLAPLRNVVLPDCAAHLIADPIGAGFIYTHFDVGAGQWRIVRTDVNGDPTAAGSLPLAPGAFIQDLHPASGDTDRILALVLETSPTRATTATVVAIDARTFSTEQTVVPGRFSGIATSASGEILLGSQRSSQIEFVRGPFPSIERERTPFDFPGEGREDLRVIGVAPADRDDAAAVAISGNQTGIVAWQPGLTTPVGPLDVDFQPGVVAPWPAQPGRVLVGGVTTQGALRGIVHGFDVPNARLLPGPVFVGEGAITAIAVHAFGDVYALLGWTGRVVRLSVSD